jgi:hypothetical protein
MGEGGADLLLEQVALTAGEGVLEAGQGGPRRRRLVGARRGSGQELEEWVGAETVGVVAVGVVGQDLVDLPGEDLLDGVGDELLGARVGQAAGQVGQLTQALIEVADGQQTGVGDDVRSVEGNSDWLPVHFGQAKVRGVTRCHQNRPPWISKWLVALHLRYT